MSERDPRPPSGGGGVVGVLLNAGLSYVMPATAARRLVRKLDSPDEDTSVAAYMTLVRLGRRLVPHLVRTVTSAPPSKGIVQVLGDIGDERAVEVLETVSRGPDADVAQVARQSLEAIRRAGGGHGKGGGP